MSKRSVCAVLLVFCLVVIASQAFATGVSWSENFDTGYASGDLLHSPWVQQTNDGITDGGPGRDVTIWVGGYSFPNSVYFAAWDLGLVSRATGASPTDTNVVAQIAMVRYGQERSWFVLSPQGNCNGTKWMNVPGSLVMDTDGYSSTIHLSSVNSAGVATTVTISNYPPEEKWMFWRFVLPQASGAQTATLQTSAAKIGPWTTVATIGVDASFKADYLGFGSYWTAGSDDVSWNIDYSPRPNTISYSNSITVDGNLSDWSPSDFVPLDKAYTEIDPNYPISYTGWPAAGASYAAKVGDNGNKVYVAVKLNDPTHALRDAYIDSFTQDDVEIYIHTAGASGPVGYNALQEAAQQYIVGIKDTNHASSWAMMGGHTNADTTSSGLERAVKVDGNWLYYEVALKPWQYFGGLASKPNVPTTLWNGDYLQLDVTAEDVLSLGLGDFAGMVSENLATGKFDNYNQIAYHMVSGMPAPPSMSIADAKNAPEGSRMEITSGVVSEAYTDFFYIEAADRASGIRVNKPGHGLTKNQMITSITGVVKTMSDTGERYIEATIASASGAQVIEPLGSSNKGLAGGGLSTTGLLVKASGKLTSLGGGIYKLNDGSGVDLRCQISSGLLGSARQWSENFDAGYSSGDLVRSPWVQQTNDGITNGVGAGRDLTIWGGGNSSPNCVYYPAWDLGLVSRPTGAFSTDINVIAQIALVRYGQERSFFALSPQADCNGTKWMNVPGSLVMETNGYWGTVALTSVNGLGVASTVEVTGYEPEAAWTLWRFVLPKASGTQTVSLERNAGSDWTPVATIGVDDSFKAANIGFGSYWTAGADDVSFSSTVGAFDPDKTYAVTGPMSLYKDPSTGNVVKVVLVKDALTDVVEF